MFVLIFMISENKFSMSEMVAIVLIQTTHDQLAVLQHIELSICQIHVRICLSK
jgi:hypothetical protein